MQTHEIVRKKFVCPFCGAQFVRKSGLNEHLVAKHHKTKQLANKFSQNAATKHESSLFNESMSFCDICKRSFKRMANLLYHMHATHVQDSKKNEQEKCAICGKEFANHSNAAKHTKKFHKLAQKRPKRPTLTTTTPHALIDKKNDSQKSARKRLKRAIPATPTTTTANALNDMKNESQKSTRKQTKRATPVDVFNSLNDVNFEPIPTYIRI